MSRKRRVPVTDEEMTRRDLESAARDRLWDAGCTCYPAPTEAGDTHSVHCPIAVAETLKDAIRVLLHDTVFMDEIREHFR